MSTVTTAVARLRQSFHSNFPALRASENFWRTAAVVNKFEWMVITAVERKRNSGDPRMAHEENAAIVAAKKKIGLFCKTVQGRKVIVHRKQIFVFSLAYAVLVVCISAWAHVWVNAYEPNDRVSPFISILGPGLSIHFILRHSFLGLVPVFIFGFVGVGFAGYVAFATQKWYLKFAALLGAGLWWFVGYFTYSITFYG